MSDEEVLTAEINAAELRGELSFPIKPATMLLWAWDNLWSTEKVKMPACWIEVVAGLIANRNGGSELSHNASNHTDQLIRKAVGGDLKAAKQIADAYRQLGLGYEKLYLRVFQTTGFDRAEWDTILAQVDDAENHGGAA